MQLAFGGQPAPIDFGRMLADGALLIYLGCLGLLMHSHETKAEALLVSLCALLLYASVRYAESPGVRNACLIGLTLGCLGLTCSWLVPVALWLNLLVFFCWQHDDRKRAVKLLLMALAIAVGMVMISIGGACLASTSSRTPIEAWVTWNYDQIGLSSIDAIVFFFKNGIWFFWPAWPFAIWAVYAWRRQRHDLHIVLALSFIVVLTALILFNPNRDESTLLPLLPALAVLASFGLPTMRRGAINAVDWFSVMVLTVGAAFVWIGWIALKTGWPPRMVKNIAKFAPGFMPEFNLFAFVVAAAATTAWFLLVYWRLSRQPKVLWRAVVLSSGGVILLWLLLTTLWLPWINYSKSYAGVAQQIAQNLPSTQTCVNARVGRAQRASFAYLGGIQLSRTDDEKCDFLLLQDRVNKKLRPDDPLMLSPPNGQWELVWEGSRPGEFYEHFRLFKKK